MYQAICNCHERVILCNHGSDIPLLYGRLSRTNFAQIDPEVSAIGLKVIHTEFTLSNQISLSQFNHDPELGNALPESMKEVTGKRIEDEVHPSVVRSE